MRKYNASVSTQFGGLLFAAISIGVQCSGYAQHDLIRLIPSSAAANSSTGIALTVQGSSGFNCVSEVVFWNSTLLTPILSCDSSNIVVTIPPAQLASTEAIKTATVTVKDLVTGLISNPLTFTVYDSTVDPGLIQSGSPQSLSSITLSTVYTTPGSGGVEATYYNNNTGSGYPTLTIANYLSNPNQGTIFSVGGGFYDVQVMNASANDTLTVLFYYPQGVLDGSIFLQYYPAGSTTPQTLTAAIQNTLDDQNGTISGGYFSYTFDQNTIPTIFALSGTVFALAPEPLNVSPSTLWPPNHTMVPVTVNAPGGTILSITSNEPQTGTGNGDVGTDWEITGPLTAKLRAERRNSGSGRIYTMLVRLGDGSQNAAVVRVPHDKGAK